MVIGWYTTVSFEDQTILERGWEERGVGLKETRPFRVPNQTFCSCSVSRGCAPQKRFQSTQLRVGRRGMRWKGDEKSKRCHLWEVGWGVGGGGHWATECVVQRECLGSCRDGGCLTGQGQDKTKLVQPERPETRNTQSSSWTHHSRAPGFTRPLLWGWGKLICTQTTPHWQHFSTQFLSEFFEHVNDFGLDGDVHKLPLHSSNLEITLTTTTKELSSGKVHHVFLPSYNEKF